MPEICIPHNKTAEWTPENWKYFLDEGLLCEDHKKIAEEKIKLIPKKVVLNTGVPGAFLPPPKIRNPKNWQDREFNNGELIE